jgi:hypothetical protein
VIVFKFCWEIGKGLAFRYINIAAKCFFRRFPQVVLVLFIFTLSASVAGKIAVSYVYYFWMFVLLVFLTLGVAIYDYICEWYIETYLEDRN